jgi:isopentenyl-diphosphate delta-isomerase
VIATGGIRDGYMVAKAVALGARFAGIGLPLLRAALESEDGPVEVLQTYRKGLELAMLASGCQRLADLSSRIQLGRPLEEEFLQSLTQTGEGFRPVGRDLGNAKPAYRQNLNSGIL